MISELKKVIERMEGLPESDQKKIAELILDELSWGNSLMQSQTELSRLAEEALEEYKNGKTKPLDL